MNPILYESRETDFNHNGLGKMNETLSAIVTEVANGEFELEVVYPIGGRLYKHIQDHMLIKAKPNSVDDPHVFRIYEHTIDTVEQTVTIYAHTKSNDLGQNLVKDVVINSLTPQEAMNTMKTNLVEPTDYSFVSDITTRSSTEWKNRNPLNCIAGEEGSLIHYWGGEIKRDNRTIYLYRRRGNDNVAIIRDGKNIDGLSLEYSTKGMVTKLIPYRTYTPENSDDEVVEYGTPVESQYIGNYPLVYVRAIDYSNDDDVTSLQTMNTKASRYFTENNGIDKPSVNVSMGLVELSDSSEYEKFKDFENVELFDSVTVYSKQYDIHIEAKITTVVYDSLAEKNISLEMGSYRTGLIESTERTYMELMGEKEAKLIQTIQIAANGKNRVFRGVDEPTTGMVKNDLWYKPIGDGEMEMYQFDGAYWQLILSTLDITKVQREVETALSEAESAKQAAEQSYADSVAEAERLVQVQTDAFNAQMSDVSDEIDTVKANIDTTISNVNQEIADNFTSLSDSISEVDDLAAQVKADADQALLDLKSKASTKALEDGLALKVATDTYNAKMTELNSLISTAQSKADTVAADLLNKPDATVVNAELAKKLATSTYNAKMNALDTAISGHTTRIEATEKGLLAKASTTDVNALKTRMSNAETSLTTNADAIALKASQEDLDAVEGRLETTEAELVVQAGEIASKVAKTDFNKLSGRVGTAESTITQQAGLIASKVSQTDFDGVNGRLKTAESSITQQAGQIALKANTTTVNALASRVSTAEASLSVQSGKIDLAATKTELTNAIDGIEVGGRNYWAITKAPWHSYLYHQGDGVFTNTSTSPSFAIFGMDRLGVPVGETYTLSFEINVSDNVIQFQSDKLYINNVIQNATHNKPTLVKDTWVKVYATFNYTEETTRLVHIYIDGMPSTNTIQIRNFQLEKGNKATDWTPAPEDVDASIAAVQSNLTVEAGKITALTTKVSGSETNITKVTQTVSGHTSTISTLRTDVNGKATIVSLNAVKSTADGNKTTISNHAGRLTTVETNVSGLQTTVSNKADKSQVTQLSNSLTSVVDEVDIAQSRITQLSSDVNIRVVKDDVVNQINISTESILISGKRIRLDGDVTMTAAYATRLDTQTLSAITANITSIRSKVLVTDSVTSTHVKADNAMIDNIFATTALITRLTSKTAFIDNIKAISISADKVTTGTLNASNVNIINLNVSKIVGLDSSFIRSNWNGINSNIDIDGTRMQLTSFDGNSTTRVYNAGFDFVYKGISVGRLGLNYTVDSTQAYLSLSAEAGQGINFAKKATAGASTYETIFEVPSGGMELRMQKNLNINGANILNATSIYTPQFVLADGLTTNGIGRFIADGAIAQLRATTRLNLQIGTTSIASISESSFNLHANLNANGRSLLNMDTVYFGTNQEIRRVNANTLDIRSNTQLRLVSYGTTIVDILYNGGTTRGVNMYANLNMQGFTVTGQSDRRLKTDIEPTRIVALDAYRQLTMVDYRWIDPNKPSGSHLGVIAQDTPFWSMYDAATDTWMINSSKQMMYNSLGVKELVSITDRHASDILRVNTYVTQHELEIKILKERIQQLEEKLA